MAAVRQQAHGQFNPLEAVRANASHMPVLDDIVEEDGWNACLMDLRYVIVMQGKTEQKSPAKAVLEHEGVIFFLRLHIEIGGEHRDVKMPARGGQLESNDDFVAKLVDAVVLHIFD